MTLFEYLTVGYSLIVSFAVLRALSGFPHILRVTSRYWVHAFWVLFGISGCLVIFWAFWRFREAEWTLLRYVLVLAVPALLYVYNSILVPSDPAAVASWRGYFFEVRVPLFATAMLMHSAAFLANVVLLGVSPLDPKLFPLVGWVGLCVVALFSASPSVHAFVVLGTALGLATTAAMMAQPEF